MFRSSAIGLLAACAMTPVMAQSPIERGAYLVNSVMTCHNCHTPLTSNGQVQMTFTSQFTPEGQVFSFGPYTMSPYVDTRFTGRQFAPTIQALVDDDWRIGSFRLDIKTGGGR